MTASQVDTKYRTFTAGEAIEAYRLVYASSALTVSKADQSRTVLGVNRETVESGGQAAIGLLNGPGTLKVQVSGAVTVNTMLYAGSTGKASANAAGRRLGLALQEATADGDIIEFLPIPDAPVEDMVNRVLVYDDFIGFVSGADALWLATLTDSGTATVGDAAGGILSAAASDGTVADNDEAYIATPNEVFLFANAKPLHFKTRVSIAAEVAAEANMIAGLVSAVGANTLLDDGGGPPASYSGAVFYKLDGGTAWLAEVSIAGTQTAITLTSPGRPTTTYQVLEIVFIPTSSTVATVLFYIDGVLVGSTTTFTYTSATEMSAVVGVKNGDGTTNVTARIDYIVCSQVR